MRKLIARGRAELIHDLAPGATLTFHTAWRSQADFASGITELRNCGADVIVDDVIYFAEPMFQDGIIADAAQAAVDAGVPYYSSAGNQAGFGVRDTFDDADVARALEGCEAAIYNIGLLREFPRRGITFEGMHFEGARRVVDAAVAKTDSRSETISWCGEKLSQGRVSHSTK